MLMLNFGNCYTSNATVPFSYDELTGQLYLNSPIENATYLFSDVEVKVYMYVGSHESEPGVHYIPYQEISCFYSLDGGDWQNMSLDFVKVHEPFSSLVNENYYYRTVDLNYTATLYNVSEGTHQLRFSVKPESIPIMFIHNQDSIFEIYLQDYFDFTVAQNPNSNNETIGESSNTIANASGVMLPTAELLTALLITSFSGAILILAVVLRKRKHLQKNSLKKDF